MKPNTAWLLIENIKDNFNKRHEFRDKRYISNIIVNESARSLSNNVSGKAKALDFNIPEIRIDREDDKELGPKIMLNNQEKRKELKIYKSTI